MHQNLLLIASITLPSIALSSNDSDFSEKCKELGTILNDKGKHHLAVSVYKRCLAKKPNDPFSLNGLMWSQHLNGERVASLASLDKLKGVCRQKICPNGLVTDVSKRVRSLTSQ